jgi:glycyl-tRNA synthetase
VVRLQRHDAHGDADGERAFYSKKTYDLEYEFPFGVSELEGIAYRTDYDLSRHIECSGKPLEYFDEETKQKFVPHVVEPSAGVDRTALALLCEAFDEEIVMGESGKSETRTVLRFHKSMAPVKLRMFQLLRKKPEIIDKAREATAPRPHLRLLRRQRGSVGAIAARRSGHTIRITVILTPLGKWPRKEGHRELRERQHEAERLAIEELKDWLIDAFGGLLKTHACHASS